MLAVEEQTKNGGYCTRHNAKKKKDKKERKVKKKNEMKYCYNYYLRWCDAYKSVHNTLCGNFKPNNTSQNKHK